MLQTGQLAGRVLLVVPVAVFDDIQPDFRQPDFFEPSAGAIRPGAEINVGSRRLKYAWLESSSVSICLRGARNSTRRNIGNAETSHSPPTPRNGFANFTETRYAGASLRLISAM